jgi:hypothetical protein
MPTVLDSSIAAPVSDKFRNVQSNVEAPLLNIICAAFKVRRRVADLFSTAIPARPEDPASITAPTGSGSF